MAQSLNITIPLGASKTGLTLKAQLFDESFADVGAPVTTGFSERLPGLYGWHYAAFPDGFLGGVDFIDDGTEEKVASIMLSAADFGTAGGGASVDDILSAEVPDSYPSGSVGAALGKIGVGVIEVTSALTPGGDLYIIKGDSYLFDNGRAIEFTDADGNWPTLTSGEVNLYLQSSVIEGEIVVASGSNKKVRFDLTSQDTEALEARKSQYAVKVIFAGVDPDPDDVITLVESRLIVKTAP